MGRIVVQVKEGAMQHKVYVMLGFHINFYHSWRGDTPDEAGFGTDMRVIRGVLDILERANDAGMQARGYWDSEVYWTFQEILPQHCPDILERLRARVAAGQDEIVLGPFNNGANHAATADEFRAALEWAIENPWGSGLRQLFPKVTPYYRPQESMVTIGQEGIFAQCGVEGLILYYAGVPFNTLGSFVPALSLQQRYNPLWMRLGDDRPPLLLLPCISTADLLEHVSLENLMLDLHERQRRGEVQSDVLIHLNADADLETWLPMRLPRLFSWFPNTGGLQEFIRAVNKYPWASFTVPSEYLAGHPPQGEVLVRQDLADGGFDGNYSWAEKCPSLHTWTMLERSRLASYRAEALAGRSGLDLRRMLWEGMQSSFFQRLIGLSTTHFGMSTPLINEERQARASAILGNSLRLAEDAERLAASACCEPAPASDEKALYDFEVFLTPPGHGLSPQAAHCMVRLPVILPEGVQNVSLVDAQGQPLPTSLTDVATLPDGRTSAEVRFTAHLEPHRTRRMRLLAQTDLAPTPPTLSRLQNEWLEVVFSEQSGLQAFRHLGKAIGGLDFLRPFVSYRRRRKAQVFARASYELLPLEGESWNGLQRLRLRASLPMQTPHGEHVNRFTYTFTLFDDLPSLFVDVVADFAYTPPSASIQTAIQKLRRLMDLRWVEVAPFQLHPALQASPEQPLRVWKHNYLGVTASYDMNYGQINPRNRNLDAFNHQVTAGWVAVSDGARGLLLGENAETLASMAFCPMRLRERGGRQSLWLNPFGSYYGKQFDYAHLGGSGVGAAFLQAFSGALRPNGPSFNGQSLEFSLMLAPYEGDAPPAALQAAAAAHFYPPSIILHGAPQGVEALLPGDVRAAAAAARHRARLESDEPLPAPTAFLANPSPGAALLVWDPPRNAALTGYEVAWRAAGETEQHAQQIPLATRWRVQDLQDGQEYRFRLRAVRGGRRSAWTAQRACIPGPVKSASLGAGLPLSSAWTLLRMVVGSLWAVLRAALRKR
jgi:hypothetical protein